MINKIIAEYLRTNKRLVVPHFGAFIRKENSEAIVFVPFLKKDDGVLQQLLVSEYGMDSADAQAVIDEYIAEIKESIAARGAYVIEGVGRLMTDSNEICYLELGAAPAQAAAVRPVDTASPVGPASFPAPSAEPARHTKIQQQARPTEKTDKLGAAASPQSPARKPEAQYPPDTRPSNPVTSRSVQDALYGNPRPAPMQAPADRQEQTFRTPMPNVRPGNQPPRPPMPPQGRPAGTGYRPSRPVGRQAPKSKADGFIVIAILAAVAALAAIIFGLTVTHGGPDILPLIESSSPDTTQVQPIAE
ncbi:hypothetical protein [Alistipes sp.]|uniref:hypothetical protein n=1 Tax=Alistipes sp. TaxID=1872444 RepID=UPI001ED7B64F|nr:hypothetical protein [Alistipes sp.]MBS1364380.1 hypothetical protein [Alistipes sp.]